MLLSISPIWCGERRAFETLSSRAQCVWFVMKAQLEVAFLWITTMVSLPDAPVTVIACIPLQITPAVFVAICHAPRHCLMAVPHLSTCHDHNNESDQPLVLLLGLFSLYLLRVSATIPLWSWHSVLLTMSIVFAMSLSDGGSAMCGA